MGRNSHMLKYKFASTFAKTKILRYKWRTSLTPLRRLVKLSSQTGQSPGDKEILQNKIQ